MPKKIKPLSATELQLFLEDRERWARRYLDGIKDPPTTSMLKGTHLHKYLQGKSEEAIDEKLYFGFEIRIAKAIKEAFDGLIPPECIKEKEVHAAISQIPTVGYWDFYHKDGEQAVVIELKTGQPWTQEKAEGHLQLGFYALQHQTLYGSIPAVLLASANTKNGRVEIFEIKDVESGMKRCQEEIMKAYVDMNNENLWEVRK